MTDDLTPKEIAWLNEHARMWNDDRDKLFKRLIAQLERVTKENEALRAYDAARGGGCATFWDDGYGRCETCGFLISSHHGIERRPAPGDGVGK